MLESAVVQCTWGSAVRQVQVHYISSAHQQGRASQRAVPLQEQQQAGQLASTAAPSDATTRPAAAGPAVSIAAAAAAPATAAAAAGAPPGALGAVYQQEHDRLVRQYHRR
jgi:hypothetical protein